MQKAIKIILESNSDKFNKDLNQRKISIVVGLSTSVFHVLDHNINIFHIHNGSLFEKLDENIWKNVNINQINSFISEYNIKKNMKCIIYNNKSNNNKIQYFS